jgi:hypothetical protein
MTIYYVDSNASGSNNGTDWANAYADISTALAGSVTTDDIIYVASNHSKLYATDTTLTFPAGVKVYSVNSSTGAYAAGALESVDNGGNTRDFTFTTSVESFVFLSGVNFTAEDNLYCSGVASRWVINDSEINFGGGHTGENLGASTDAVWITIKNSEINFSTAGVAASTAFPVSGGSRLDLINVTSTGTPVSNLFGTGGNGGAIYNMSNCRLDLLLKDTGTLIYELTANDDMVIINIDRCRMPANYSVITSGTWVLPNYEVKISSSGNADESHYFYEENLTMIVEEDTTTYLTATYDGTTGFSTEIATTADTNDTNYARYKLASLPNQDLTSDTTYEVEFTCASTLTDTDCWIELVRPDVTNEASGVLQSSRASDILAAGTTHTTSAASWTNGLTNDYKESLTVTGSAGVDNLSVDVYFCLARPSITINVDPAVTIS